jgi:hypothetical protein
LIPIFVAIILCFIIQVDINLVKRALVGI